VGPLYLSELPPENLRGFLGTINALAICAGCLLTNIFGLPSVLGSEERWPYLLSLILIPALIHICGLWFCIDSPKYLYITKNDPQSARKGKTNAL
jgi:SP family facilitated glucose transporter-like MFS transporter 1